MREVREVWVGLTPDWWLCLFLLARLTSSIRSTETDTDWLRRLRYQFWSNVYITVDTGEQGPTQQAGPPVQNELYFHNDYNVAQCSCQEKAHPSEDCEQPKNNSALTSLLHHSLSLSYSWTLPSPINVLLSSEMLTLVFKGWVLCW